MAKRSLKYNTAVLTVTGFLVKAIGFVYRVFIANSIGSEGLGLYQLVTPIYSLLVLVLSAGIQIAVSRFVAEELSKRMDHKGMRITSIAALMTLVIGAVVCGVLILNLDTLVFTFTGDARTKRSLFYMLILLPPIAAGSAYKGYFYGRQEMLPNSAGQIIEQISKLIFVLLMYNSFKGQGLESMCLLAVIAMLVGEYANVLTVYVIFLYSKSKKKNTVSQSKSIWQEIRKISKTAVPISVNRLILSTIGTAESLIIPKRLLLYGYTTQQSLMAFGRLSGMAAPLVFFPSMLPAALATALVPAIAGAFASKQYSLANRQISLSIKLTLTMGLIFTTFFACSSYEIAELIYPGQSVAGILYLLSFTGVFLYLQQTMLGILNGLSRETTILLNTLAGSVVRLVMIWFLMPIWGIDAYLYSVIAGSMIVVVLNFREIIKITGISIDVGEWVLKPLAAALGSAALSMLLKNLPYALNLSGKMAMMASAGITIVVILAVFLLAGIINREDLMRWTGMKNNRIMSIYEF